MLAIQINFHKEIIDLRNLINFYNLESKLNDTFNNTSSSKEELLINELSESMKKFRLSKLQFNYNTIIISLYGSFERFIENCLIMYVDKLNRIYNLYNNLPAPIIKNHLALSMTLLSKIEQPKYSGALTKEEVIKNLHSCIDTNEGYQLNKDAFALHTANFRLQVIDESFSHIGIGQISNKIMKVETFRDYSRNKLGLNENTKLMANESFQIINNLAEYRNYVAHGINSEIITNEILLDYLEFFEKYSASLIEILNKDLAYKELGLNSIELGEITDLYKEGKVICFKTNCQKVKQGDYLIGKNKSSIIKTLIKKIKLDNVEITSIEDDKNYEIGVEIQDVFKKNFKLYLLKNNGI